MEENNQGYGTLIAILGLVAVAAVGAAIFLPVTAGGDPPRQTHALSKVKQLGTALTLYLGDYDDVHPQLGQNLQHVLNPYVRNQTLFSFKNEKGKEAPYMFNRNLTGLSAAKIPDLWNTVSLFLSETVLSHNQMETRTILCFEDGHAKATRPESTADLIWNPHHIAVKVRP